MDEWRIPQNNLSWRHLLLPSSRPFACSFIHRSLAHASYHPCSAALLVLPQPAQYTNKNTYKRTQTESLFLFRLFLRVRGLCFLLPFNCQRICLTVITLLYSTVLYVVVLVLRHALARGGVAADMRSRDSAKLEIRVRDTNPMLDCSVVMTTKAEVRKVGHRKETTRESAKILYSQ